MDQLSALGSRLEIRLGDHFKPQGQLTYGTAWQPDTAERIFRRELKVLRFPAKVSPTWARREAVSGLTAAELRTYLLWTHGEPLSIAAGSPKTVGRHEQIIRAKLGFSIRQPASAVLGWKGSIDPRAVLNWKNRVVAEAVDLDRDLGNLSEHALEFD